MAGIGLQLYTLRDLMKEDFVGVLEKVAKIGYQGVEFAGFGGMPAAQLYQIVDGLGLTPVSAHIPLTDLENDLERVIDDAKALHLGHIVCPFLPENRRQTKDDYTQLAQLLTHVGTQCKQAGIQLAYHNHAFELVKFDDEYALDYLYASTNPEDVQAELDIYWVEKGGESAANYIDKYAHRCDLLHVKDMTDDDEKFFAEVGQGQLNLPNILAHAEAANVKWYIVEQDVCRRNPFESIEISYRYLSQR